MILVRTDDIDLGRGTFIDGPWDQDVIDIVIQAVERLSGRAVAGRTVIEVGANIGTTTLLLLRRYGAARVVAFEPAPMTAALLRANVVLNDLDDRVDFHAIALSDSPGDLAMELSARSTGDNRIRTVEPVDGVQGEADREVIPVHGTTLDLAVEDLSEVVLVW